MDDLDKLQTDPSTTKIARHKTALHRKDMSLPMRCLVSSDLIDQHRTILDYGCGRGEDVRQLQSRGVACHGWDPTYFPESSPEQSNIVNLGYVINVIEDPAERSDVLRRAWSLCDQVLCVSAQILVQGRSSFAKPYNDGTLTRLGTFQKYFTHEELREYIERELSTEAIPAAPGIYFVFRDKSLREVWAARRYKRKHSAPKRSAYETRYEEYRPLLESLLNKVSSLGRMPEQDEFEEGQDIVATFGSLKRAFAIIQKVTDSTAWETIRVERSEDLLVYMALGRFSGRPAFSRLPLGIQRDIKAFYGTYSKACSLADELLFNAGDESAVDNACKKSAVGKRLPDALYVHKSALDHLSPLLRVFEGCARAYIGDVVDANIIKLHSLSGKVSYLAYPEFETNPHPSLVRGVKVALRTREVSCYDYVETKNPPVLHRKELMLHNSHSNYSKFSKLTEQEDRAALLDETATIGTKDGWQNRLAERGFELRGHRLIKCRHDTAAQTATN